MDVVILGGGIVGLTMANLLAQSNLQIGIIEPNIPLLEWDANSYDLRCSAITRAVQNIFISIGVWNEIVADRLSYYDQMHVWDCEPSNKVCFSARAIHEPNLGYIIENRSMLRALHKKLVQQNNVTFIRDCATDFQQRANINHITTGDKNITCKLLIGADGANSWLRNRLNIDVNKWDYQHHALVANIQTELPHNNTARQRFLPDGPLAFLPLSHQHMCSIVWSSSPDKIQTLMQTSAEDFTAELKQQFAATLGDLHLKSERASFPLRMLHACNYVLPGIALIGDAAHVIHPLAGQGLNLGIMDAGSLAEVVLQAYNTRVELGSLRILRRFERERKAHNLSMLTLVEGLKRFYAQQNPGVKNLRRFGMRLVDNLPIAKNFMMHYALQL
jgi:2-octaprenylphenol hydroxylase